MTGTTPRGRLLRGAVVGALTVMLAVVAAAPADAVTWTPTPTQTITTTGKAVIRPLAPLPKGAKVTKSVVTVKRGTKTLATNVASLSVPKGTYKAYSTITFRPRLTHLVPIALTQLSCRYTTIDADAADVAALTFEYVGQPPVSHVFGPVHYTVTETCSGVDSTGTSRAWSRVTTGAAVAVSIWGDDRAGSCGQTVLSCAPHQSNTPTPYFAPPLSIAGLYHSVPYYGAAVTRHAVRTVKVVHP